MQKAVKPLKAWAIASKEGKIVYWGRDNDEKLWRLAFLSDFVPPYTEEEVKERNAIQWMKWKGYRAIPVLISPV